MYFSKEKILIDLSQSIFGNYVSKFYLLSYLFLSQNAESL